MSAWRGPRVGVVLLAGSVALAAAGRTPPSGPWTWHLPPGFPEPVVPPDNPMSAAKVELGRHLFYDRRLSGNRTQSCATCHEQARAFTESRATSLGSTGEAHPRGSMSLANVAYSPVLTWANPAQRHLESQALVPMFGENPVELGMTLGEAELPARLRADPTYRRLFAEAFPDEADPYTILSVTRALAAFERTMLSGNAPYDRANHGDPAAMSDAAKRGQELFFGERLECFHCHGGPTLNGPMAFVGKGFTEVEFHNTGLYNLDATGSYPAENTGVFEHTGDPEDMGRFKAPTLRNIAVTAPYMHDGSIATLDGVIDHYAAGGRTIATGAHAGIGRDNPHKSSFVAGFELTASERADLLAFLESLTDSTFLTDPRLADPWQGRDLAPLDTLEHR